MSASSAIPSNPRDRVHLTEVLAQLPGMAWDLPILARGIISGIKSNPKGRWSIGALFAERAAKHADRVFLVRGHRHHLRAGERHRQPVRRHAGLARCGSR
jgi:hypothetical protein